MSGDDRPGSDHEQEATDMREPMTLADEGQATIEHQKDPAADALQSFANTIQEKAGPVSNGASADLGASAAERVEQVADFVYERRPGDAFQRVQSTLRQQPLAGVALGIALGFVLGRLTK